MRDSILTLLIDLPHGIALLRMLLLTKDVAVWLQDFTNQCPLLSHL